MTSPPWKDAVFTAVAASTHDGVVVAIDSDLDGGARGEACRVALRWLARSDDGDWAPARWAEVAVGRVAPQPVHFVEPTAVERAAGSPVQATDAAAPRERLQVVRYGSGPQALDPAAGSGPDPGPLVEHRSLIEALVAALQTEAG